MAAHMTSKHELYYPRDLLDVNPSSKQSRYKWKVRDADL